AQPKTSNIEHRTSNIEHRTSNIQHRTSNIEHPTSNIQHRTSNTWERPARNRPLEVGSWELDVGCWMFLSRKSIPCSTTGLHTREKCVWRLFGLGIGAYLELYALSFELPYPQGSCRTAK